MQDFWCTETSATNDAKASFQTSCLGAKNIAWIIMMRIPFRHLLVTSVVFATSGCSPEQRYPTKTLDVIQKLSDQPDLADYRQVSETLHIPIKPEFRYFSYNGANGRPQLHFVDYIENERVDNVPGLTLSYRVEYPDPADRSVSQIPVADLQLHLDSDAKCLTLNQMQKRFGSYQHRFPVIDAPSSSYGWVVPGKANQTIGIGIVYSEQASACAENIELFGRFRRPVAP